MISVVERRCISAGDFSISVGMSTTRAALNYILFNFDLCIMTFLGVMVMKMAVVEALAFFL